MEGLRAALASGDATPFELAERALARANQNAGRNVYLALDKNWTLAEAKRAQSGIFNVSSGVKPPLLGLPVSLKDCFDLEGFLTTAGTRFYAERNTVAREDSAVAKRLRRQGAVITGKTHLHPLAYGITGENRDFGDCLQPANRNLLTGGSTSGGAASVQEGSAAAAIGTDTGGSIRVPAALCGLAGYRASIGLAWERGLWSGGIHLAQSFDTLGWIFKDLGDAPLLAEALFGLKVPGETSRHVRVGAMGSKFLDDCEPSVLRAFESFQQALAAGGAEIREFEASYWEDALSIYAPIQAHEAAAIHAPTTGRDFSAFPAPIAERLEWGASLTADEVTRQRGRHREFRERADQLFESFDFLILPCSPIGKLEAGRDHTETRSRILRYTTPFSLTGTPVVAVPMFDGAGMQLTARRGEDARLLAYAAALQTPGA
jgi:Asp-tRNA(Asn)/Glu-tRNA(Gln) amidotransferase A subunit family amidase